MVLLADLRHLRSHPEEVSGPGTTYSAPSIGETAGSTVISAGERARPQPAVLVAGLRHLAVGTSNRSPARARRTPPGSVGENNNSGYVSNNANAIAAEGAGNGLDYYWQTFGTAQWNKQVVASSEAAYSAPPWLRSSLQPFTNRGLREVNDIYVVGPAHSLVDWDQGLSSGGWAPVAIAGNGKAFSAPAVDTDEASFLASDYNTQVAYEGPGDSLLYYWKDHNGSGTETVAGPGTTISAPTIADGNNSTSITAQGPGDSLAFYWQQTGTDDTWNQEPVANSGSTYSVPAMAEGNNSTSIVSEGPNRSVGFYWQTDGGTSGWNPEAPSGKGSTA